jgi:hypothetical protein
MEMDNKAKMDFFMRMSPAGKTKAAQRKKPRSPVPNVYADVRKTPLQQVVPAEGAVRLELRRTAR